MAEYHEKRSAEGAEKKVPPTPPDLPEPRAPNGGGKRPTLPGLHELFNERPLPLLSPNEMAEILQRPTPISPEGATAAEVTYYQYTRLAELERAFQNLLATLRGTA